MGARLVVPLVLVYAETLLDLVDGGRLVVSGGGAMVMVLSGAMDVVLLAAGLVGDGLDMRLGRVGLSVTGNLEGSQS